MRCRSWPLYVATVERTFNARVFRYITAIGQIATVRPGLNERSNNKLVYIFYSLQNFYFDFSSMTSIERKSITVDLENHVRFEIDCNATLIIDSHSLSRTVLRVSAPKYNLDGSSIVKYV